jgi:hypothetical protein
VPLLLPLGVDFILYDRRAILSEASFALRIANMESLKVGIFAPLDRSGLWQMRTKLLTAKEELLSPLSADWIFVAFRTVFSRLYQVQGFTDGWCLIDAVGPSTDQQYSSNRLLDQA